jgi:hypothetical protein
LVKKVRLLSITCILNMSSSIINHQSSIIKIHNYIIIHHHHPGPHTLILIIIDSPCSTRPRIPRNNRLALLHAPLLFLRVLRAELRPQLRQVVRQAAGLVAADASGAGGLGTRKTRSKGKPRVSIVGMGRTQLSY